MRSLVFLPLFCAAYASADEGAPRFRRVLDPVQRVWIFQHFSAQIEEIGPSLMHAETEHVRRFAVDSWYVDNGRPAPVIPLKRWQEGNDPDV